MKRLLCPKDSSQLSLAKFDVNIPNSCLVGIKGCGVSYVSATITSAMESESLRFHCPSCGWDWRSEEALIDISAKNHTQDFLALAEFARTTEDHDGFVRLIRFLFLRNVEISWFAEEEASAATVFLNLEDGKPYMHGALVYNKTHKKWSSHT